MCVCIKRLINFTFLGGVSLAAPQMCPTWAGVVPSSLKPLWRQRLRSQGHSFWFLSSWLQSAREDPEGPHGPGRVVPANIAEGESQTESHSMRKGGSLCYCAACLRIFLFQELKGENGGWGGGVIRRLRSTKCHHILDLYGIFFEFRMFSSSPSLLSVFIMKKCWSLSSAFSVSVEMIMWLFSLF